MVTDIVFDENDPLTIHVEQDRTLVTMRATFKPGGQEVIPPLAVTIEYRTELVGDKILVTPGKPRVELLTHDDNDSTPGLALSLISQAIEANLTKLAFDRTLPKSLWSFGGTVPRVVGLRSNDGWAAVSID